MSERLRILVPLDGSAEAESVLPLVAPLVRARSSRLTLFRTVLNGEPPGPALAYLERLRDALVPHGVEARVSTEWGRAAEEIAWLGQPSRFDLVAMTTHGRSGLQRVFMGSVAEEVLRNAGVPVLLNRPGMKTRPWTRFVVALDGSARGEAVLPDAVRLAQAFGAALHVVQAAVPPMPVLVDVSGVGDAKAEDPEPYLKGVCARLSQQGVAAVPAVLEGDVVDEVLGYVEREGAGLLCVASHGRTGMPRALFGSVAERLVRRSPCPVLVRRAVEAVRSPEAQVSGGTSARG